MTNVEIALAIIGAFMMGALVVPIGKTIGEVFSLAGRKVRGNMPRLRFRSPVAVEASSEDEE